MRILPNLNFPEYSFSCRQENEKEFIFDPIRKKWVVLTPEEWVRQHLVQFLISDRQVPVGLIALEKTVTINRLTKRFDLLIYSPQAQPIFLAECKAPGVLLSQNVLDQVARYNLAYQVPYLLITNGLSHYCCKVDHQKNKIILLSEVPLFSSMINLVI